MRPKHRTRTHELGITLVEIILTIVLISYAAAITFQFMFNTAQSNKPANILQSEVNLGQALEEITADYIQRANSYITAGAELTPTAFNASISTSVTPTHLTVTADQRCFSMNGDLEAACPANQIPLLRVRVQEQLVDFGNASGRTYYTLFAKTRVYTDPPREH